MDIEQQRHLRSSSKVSNGTRDTDTSMTISGMGCDLSFTSGVWWVCAMSNAGRSDDGLHGNGLCCNGPSTNQNFKKQKSPADAADRASRLKDLGHTR